MATHAARVGKRAGQEATRLQEEYIEAQKATESAPSDPPAEPQEPRETPSQETETAKAPAETGTDWRKESERLQAKLSTLTGKYNAEVPRLQAEIRQLRQDNESLRARAEQTEQATRPSLSQEERDELGDLASVIEARDQRISALEAQLKAIQQRDESSRQDSEQERMDRFWSDLTEAVPDWAEVNESPDFHVWLNQVDMASGLRRQELLADAQAKANPRRVAYFFNQFKGERRNEPAGTGPATPKERSPHPDPSGGGDGGEVRQPRTWTGAEINEFFRAKQAGVLRKQGMSEAQVAAMERDIFAANAEGRIRG